MAKCRASVRNCDQTDIGHPTLLGIVCIQVLKRLAMGSDSRKRVSPSMALRERQMTKPMTPCRNFGKASVGQTWATRNIEVL